MASGAQPHYVKVTVGACLGVMSNAGTGARAAWQTALQCRPFSERNRYFAMQEWVSNLYLNLQKPWVSTLASDLVCNRDCSASPS
jgi:hypothetical protein